MLSANPNKLHPLVVLIPKQKSSHPNLVIEWEGSLTGLNVTLPG